MMILQSVQRVCILQRRLYVNIYIKAIYVSRGYGKCVPNCNVILYSVQCLN